MLFSYQKPNIERILSELTDNAGVRVLMRREDTVHLPVGGNKWWKLKYNLTEARQLGERRILTFGGAWSNHIYATAAAARIAGVESIGIIRGERPMQLNPVLSFAEGQGMTLKFISREEYRKKTEGQFLENLRKEFHNFFLIPEGGSNVFGFRGCEEWGEMISGDPGDFVCLPCGTGTTVAGVISGLKNEKHVIGFSVLKGDFISDSVREFLTATDRSLLSKWHVENNYHFGGYARSTPALEKFIASFVAQFSIPIEPVYTGKMMYGIFDLIRKGYFPRGSTVLAIHTGGVH